jgi:uncharacterized membrane protein YhaH (DUF805 family)|tara:strand:- start:217 stop:759 length:543 start_codon:yes stop_codon:yes gene_type:complete
MDFGTAIKTCFSKYGTFDGQASKGEFWYWFLFAFICGVVARVVDVFIIGIPVESYGTAYLIGSVAFFLPSISVAARRLHDVGKSGWWQLIGLTGIGLIPLIIWWASDGGKKYRPSITRRDDDEPPPRRSRERSESKFSSGSSRKSGKIDVVDELEEVKELYEDGTLSEAQFKKAKKKLLK